MTETERLATITTTLTTTTHAVWTSHTGETQITATHAAGTWTLTHWTSASDHTTITTQARNTAVAAAMVDALLFHLNLRAPRDFRRNVGHALAAA